MSGDTLGSIVLGACTVVAAVVAAYASITVSRRTKTNHGKTIGQHVEQLGDDVRDLASLFAKHMVSDADNFAELRSLIEKTDSH